MERTKTKDLRRTMSRRALFLSGGSILFTSFLVSRLYQLQVAQNSRYSRLSDRNQYDIKIVPPVRGRLFDIKNRLLAGNAESFLLYLTPLYVDDVQKTLIDLAKIVNLSRDLQRDVIVAARKGPSFRHIIIRDDLSQRELARLAVRSPLLNGVSFGKSLRRIYPQGSLACHITGYVSPITANEIDQNPVLAKTPYLATGKVGVELAQEEKLRGMSGRERIEVNALGHPIQVLRDTDARSGEDLRLSIDISIQVQAVEILRRGNLKSVNLGTSEVQSALSKDDDLKAHIALGDDLILRDAKDRLVPPESGAAVVMDIQTGEIISLVSLPMFDPNLFTGKLLTRDWKRLNMHPRKPLLNRVISGQYAPGSTFKMVVGLAALEAGVINKNTTFNCSGDMELGNATFHCWRKGGHGMMNIITALEQSCDVFFYEISLKTGIRKIKDMAHRLGLGDVTGIDLFGEKSGIIPSHEWKLANQGSVWTPGETVVSSIGQGYVLATPLQLAVMTARLSNGKSAVSPSLIKPQNGQQILFPPLNIEPEALSIIQEGMQRVMTGGLGTARKYNLAKSFGGMAGKTGTVQVKRITKAQREKGIVKNIDRPWAERDHALFVGYAPIIKPRFAISVIVEHGGSGSSTAAPIARDILIKTMQAKS
ncbi:penicillin-binding protein 2 [Candidatus Puniceispirillum sp.]|nr:penicillin-binding protein 2 [Candidatus Puniceispirillum sp.]